MRITRGLFVEHVVLLGLMIGVAACSGVDPEPSMREERRELTSEVEVSELLGFALVDALAREHVYSGNLTWSAAPERVAFSPSSSGTQVTWSFVMPRDSEQWPIQEVNVHCDRERVATNTRQCADRLETILTLRLRSEDGALDEELAVTFEALSPTETYWKHTNLDIDGLRGDFRLETGPEALAVRLSAFGSVSGQTGDGELIGDVLLERERRARSETTAGMVFYVARWTAMPIGAAP